MSVRPDRVREDVVVLGTENRWLVALTLFWLVVPLWFLRIATDTAVLVEDPPVMTLRTFALLAPSATAALAFLHARANRVPRPLAKALVTAVLLSALGWGAWVWTLDAHRGSGVGLAVPLALVALVAGGLAGSRSTGARRPESGD